MIHHFLAFIAIFSLYADAVASLEGLANKMVLLEPKKSPTTLAEKLREKAAGKKPKKTITATDNITKDGINEFDVYDFAPLGLDSNFARNSCGPVSMGLTREEAVNTLLAQLQQEKTWGTEGPSTFQKALIEGFASSIASNTNVISDTAIKIIKDIINEHKAEVINDIKSVDNQKIEDYMKFINNILNNKNKIMEGIEDMKVIREKVKDGINNSILKTEFLQYIEKFSTLINKNKLNYKEKNNIKGLAYLIASFAKDCKALSKYLLEKIDTWINLYKQPRQFDAPLVQAAAAAKGCSSSVITRNNPEKIMDKIKRVFWEDYKTTYTVFSVFDVPNSTCKLYMLSLGSHFQTLLPHGENQERLRAYYTNKKSFFRNVIEVLMNFFTQEQSS